MILPEQYPDLMALIHETLRERSTEPPAGSQRSKAANQAKFDLKHAGWKQLQWDDSLSDDEVWKRIRLIPFYAGVLPPPEERFDRTAEFLADYREVGQPGWIDSPRAQEYLTESKAYKFYDDERKLDPSLPDKMFAYWSDKESKGPTIVEGAARLLKRQQTFGHSLLDQLVPLKYRKFTNQDLQDLFKVFQARSGYSFITAFHALMDLGVPVVKPDTMLVRTAVRLGLVDASPFLPHRTGLKVNSDHARDLGQKAKFVWPLEWLMNDIAAKTQKSVREVDWLFAKMGMKANADEGREIVICDEVPKCHLCLARPMCAYAIKYNPVPVFRPAKKGKGKSRRIKSRELAA
jgi:hypothetical protein